MLLDKHHQAMLLGKHHQLTLDEFQAWGEDQRHARPEYEVAARRVLEILRQSVSFDAAWVLKVDPASSNIVDIFLDRFCQKAFSRYLDLFYAMSPVPTLQKMKQLGLISLRGSEQIDPLLWKEDRFCQEVLHPLGLRYFLAGAWTDASGAYHGLLVLWRRTDRHDFSVLDAALLERASGSLAEGFDRTRSIPVGAEKPEIMRLVSRRAYPGVLVLGKANEIYFMNGEARNLIGMLRSGKALLSRTDEGRFMEKMHQLRADVLSGTLGDQRDVTTRPVVLFTFRGTLFSCRGIPLGDGGGAAGLVMILIETVKEGDDPPSLFDKQGSDLTAREGAVARLLYRGYTNKEIASEMGIGVHTVKGHVKNLMRKLKTTTRSGVVSRIMVG